MRLLGVQSSCKANKTDMKAKYGDDEIPEMYLLMVEEGDKDDEVPESENNEALKAQGETHENTVDI